MSINFNTLTEEQKVQIAQIASIAGVSIEELLAPKKKKAEINRLKMKNNSETIAIDVYSGEEFDISTLTPEELTNAKRTGLSPASFAKYQEGEKIKSLLKGAKTRVRSGVSAGEQVRIFVENASSAINESVMELLTNKDFCKKEFGLAYPLLQEIPVNATEEERKELRKVNGVNRFAAKIWTFKNLPGREFHLTNDIYSRNVSRIETFFANLTSQNS